MATVQDIWTSALPAGTDLLAGTAGLTRSVREVLVLKPRPPGLPPPGSDELILLSTRTLEALDPGMSLARTIASVTGRAAAVAVRGEVDAQAVESAERTGLPLFRLPGAEPIPDVEDAVIAFLAAERDAWYRRRHSMLHDLAALAVQGEGLGAIARHMGRATERAVLFTDDRGEVLAVHIPDGWTEAQAQAVQGAAHGDGLMSPNGRAALAAQGLDHLVLPVVVRDHRVGFVSMVGAGTSDDLRAILEAGATAGAIELAREHAVRETVHRIQGDLVADILMRSADDADLERRARRMGHDLDLLRAALVLAPTDASAAGLDALVRRLPRVLANHEVDAPLHVEDDMVAVFYPVPPGGTNEGLQRTVQRLRHDLVDLVGRDGLAIGVGRPHSGLEGLRASYGEALRALELGRALGAADGDTYFDNLGVFRLLFALRETNEMRAFYGEMVGTLAAHDRDKRTEFVPTVDAYISSRNATETAARLNLHRNSLLYRLRRIREVSGLDLDDPETRLALHLALRIGQVLHADSQVPG